MFSNDESYKHFKMIIKHAARQKCKHSLDKKFIAHITSEGLVFLMYS